MYRKTKTASFKSGLTNRQSTGSAESNDVPENVDERSKNAVRNYIRSTKQILNLFEQPLKSGKEEIPKSSESIKESSDDTNNVKENVASSLETDNKLIFNVVIGKKSTRKHKKWDNDGTLEVTGKRAVLKDTDGNIINRTTVNPENLVEGFRLYADNKEIEIVDRVSASDCSLNQHSKEVMQEPPQKRLRTMYTPLVVAKSSKRGLQLTYEPLVMPRLNNAEGWLEQELLEKEEEVSVDYCLASVLRLHQRHGTVFLYECVMGMKVSNYFGAILADEMGLGKTLQCITIIWTLLKKGPYGKPVLKRALIVTPSSLCDNWNKEFGRWLGYHRICPYVVNAKNKPKDFKNQPRSSVMIISYDMLLRYQEDVEQITFDLMICDEGHRLKNNDVKVAKFLRSMDCKRRIILTGTPIQNDLQEFFSLIDFVNPGILGSASDFKNEYEGPIVLSRCPYAAVSVASMGQEKARELRDRTKCFILRRTQDTINKYLPSKHEIVVFCRLSSHQENMYSRIVNTWFDRLVLPTNNIPHLTIITALKKICNHPDLFDSKKCDILQSEGAPHPNKTFNAKSIGIASVDGYCGKVTVVQSLMRSLKKTDEKLVLISYFTQTLDLLQKVCSAENLKFLRLDGSTPNSSRSKIVEQFNLKADDNKVFLLSAKAGGVGLNLPGASRLVLFDSDWNPASDAQAMARIWREGQKKNVYIYRLLMTGTIEEKIFQRQISKAGLSETVVDLNNSPSLKLSIEELKDLFTLAMDTNCLTHDLMKCSCNGQTKKEKLSVKVNFTDRRTCQLQLEEKQIQHNLAINQLLEWEHYKQPIPDDIMQDIMLSEVSNNYVTFIFKNSQL